MPFSSLLIPSHPFSSLPSLSLFAPDRHPILLSIKPQLHRWRDPASSLALLLVSISSFTISGTQQSLDKQLVTIFLAAHVQWRI